MTFSACTPPLSEALKLWDFLLAYGIHLNILCIISQLILIRSSLFTTESPMKLLRTLPDLQAKKIIQVTLTLIPQLPEDLYDMLVRHPFDPFVHDILLPENVSSSEEE
jgi:cell cycle arrest protein BUB2